MIDIEKQSEEYKNKLAREHYDYYLLDFAKMCFQDGAKWGMEHAIEWHDLRENPDDLPKLKYRDNSWSVTVVNQLGEACHYNYKHSRWENPLFIEIEGVIAWCELPQYKDKE